MITMVIVIIKNNSRSNNGVLPHRQFINISSTFREHDSSIQCNRHDHFERLVGCCGVAVGVRGGGGGGGGDMEWQACHGSSFSFSLSKP